MNRGSHGFWKKSYILKKNLFYSSFLFSFVCSRRYQSKIIGLYLGRYPVVTIYDYEIAKELFSREDLTGRPNNFAYRNRMLGEKQGR